MVTVHLVIAAASADMDALHAALRYDAIISASGLINLRWEDFSALEVAQTLGLTGVAWDAVRDDTPGTLTLHILYPNRAGAEVKAEFEAMTGIEECFVYETYAALNYCN